MQALSQKLAVAPAAKVHARRQQTVVCAAQQQQEVVPRREALAAVAAAVLGLTASAAEAAQPAPKNSYVASSEGYNMEGTKKQGVSVSRKKQVLAKVRASAGKK